MNDIIKSSEEELMIRKKLEELELLIEYIEKYEEIHLNNLRIKSSSEKHLNAFI